MTKRFLIYPSVKNHRLQEVKDSTRSKGITGILQPLKFVFAVYGRELNVLIMAAAQLSARY